MGKFDAVVEKLPPVPREHNEYQDRVDAVKAELQGRKPNELAALVVTVRNEIDDLELSKKALNLRLEALTQLTLDLFDAEGLASIKLEDGSSVSRQLEPYAGVEDKEAFRLWCLSQGLERSMHLWPATVQSMVKERLLNGEADPPGVKVFVKPKLVVRGR